MMIKRKLFIVIFAFSSLPSFGQGIFSKGFSYSPERIYHSAGLQFVAGFTNGIADNLQFHYNQTIFPQGPGEKFLWGGEQYWNPDLSWRNKYEDWPRNKSESFPLSSSALVWTTDAWHLSRSAERLAHRITIVTYKQPEGPGKGWKKLLDIALMSISYSAGSIAGAALTTK